MPFAAVAAVLLVACAAANVHVCCALTAAAGPALEVMLVPMAERKTNMDFIYSELPRPALRRGLSVE